MITLDKLREAIDLMPEHVREMLTALDSFMSMHPTSSFTMHWETVFEDIESGLEHYHEVMSEVPDADEIEARTGALLEDE